MTARLPGWESRLFAFLQSREAEPFAWGTNDCCSFAADAVAVLTGERPDYPDGLSDAKAVLRELNARGGMRGVLTGVLGQPVKPGLAGRGDIVMFDQEEHGETAALCMGAFIYAPGEKGLVRYPRSAIRLAWLVGYEES